MVVKYLYIYVYMCVYIYTHMVVKYISLLCKTENFSKNNFFQGRIR